MKVLTGCLQHWLRGSKLLNKYLKKVVYHGLTPTAGHFIKERAGRSEETRLNSSHITISYAVFCLKKKKKKTQKK